MANTATLTSLILRAARRADMEFSTFLSQAEWTDLINEGLAELHDILVTNYENQIVTSATTSLVAGTDTYALPTDFYKVVGMDWESGTQRKSLKRFMFAERNIYRESLIQGTVDYLGGPYFEYALEGANFRLIPLPSAVATIRIWYVPQLTQLAAGGDVVSVSVVNGWEQLVVLSAAIKALAKEESDTSALEREKAELKNRIISASKMRDAAEPAHVIDVTAIHSARFPWL